MSERANGAKGAPTPERITCPACKGSGQFRHVSGTTRFYGSCQVCEGKRTIIDRRKPVEPESPEICQRWAKELGALPSANMPQLVRAMECRLEELGLAGAERLLQVCEAQVNWKGSEKLCEQLRAVLAKMRGEQ